MSKSTTGEITTRSAPPAAGLLNPYAEPDKFRLSRHLPAADLRGFIRNYWIVSWDRRGEAPYLQENLPHPCVNLVFERAKTQVYGVVTERFTYLLQEKGRVLGVKFRAGAFYPFLRRPVASLVNRSISCQEVFGVDIRPLEDAVLGCPEGDCEDMVRLVEAFLRERLPEPDPTIDLINEIVDGIGADRQITKVEDVARRFAMSKRTLQRLFHQYVGANPKWIIKGFRLREAADQLAADAVTDWTQLALALGYFDQAHFIKDFKTVVGSTPAAYARRMAYARSMEAARLGTS